MTNRFLPTNCVHVRLGHMPAGEELTLTTVGERDADYRYTKGPDTIQLCLFCAGRVLGYLSLNEIIGTPDEREGPI
jgi:hypothetical protein